MKTVSIQPGSMTHARLVLTSGAQHEGPATLALKGVRAMGVRVEMGMPHVHRL